MFVVFAAAAVAWSLVVMFARRRAILAASFVAIAAAAASIVIDVRAIHLARGAHPSGVAIRITRRGDWWQLEYERDGVAFVTANELHVPAGAAVSLSWSGLPPPSIAGAVCVPRPDDRCTLVAEGAEAATFVRLWPPLW